MARGLFGPQWNLAASVASRIDPATLDHTTEPRMSVHERPNRPRYAPGAEIGRGRRAVVLEAEDPRLGRLVALKRSIDPEFDSILRAEGRRLACLDSPHVVRVLDLDEGPPATLVLERLVGQTLRAQVGSDPSWNLARVDAIAVQLLEGLADLHAGGIVHGDVKPENLWITPRSRLVLLDIGGDPAAGGDATALYAAPEVLRGESSTWASDLYAAGVVIFELLCGRTPFDAADATELAARKNTQVAPLARHTGASVNEDIETWLARVLARDPAQRFASAPIAADAWRRAIASARVASVEDRAQSLHPEIEASLRACLESQAERHVVILAARFGLGKTTLLENWVRDARAIGTAVIFLAPGPEPSAVAYADWNLALRTPHVGLEHIPLGAPDADPTSLIQQVEASLQSASGRIAFVADDFEALDPATRALLLQLANARLRTGIVFVLGVTQQSGAEARQLRIRLRRLESALWLQLEPPGTKAWMHFTATRLDTTEVGEGLVEFVRCESGGNPRLATWLLEAWRRGGMLERTDAGWILDDERCSGVVPAAAADHFENELLWVPAASRRLLQKAAVQGARFDPGLLAQHLNRESGEVLQELHAIGRSFGLLRRTEDGYSFVEPLCATYLAADLTPEARRREHAALAEILEHATPPQPGLTGEHWFHAGHLSHAAPRLEKAGRTALDEDDAAAARWLDLAVRCWQDHQAQDESEARHRADLELQLAEALRRTAAWDRAAAALERAALIACAWGLQEFETRAARARGEIEYARSRFDAAVEHYLAAQASAKRCGDVRELHEIALQIGNIHFERGRLDEASAEYQNVLSFATQHADTEMEARAANNVGLVESIQGRKQSAVDYFDRSLRSFRALGRLDAVARLYQNIGMIYLELGHWAEARNFFERAMTQSEACGLDAVVAVSSLDYAEATIRLGAAEAAVEPVRRALLICRERGDELGIANALRLQGSLAAARGEIETAEKLLGESIVILERLGQALHLGISWKEMGAVRLQAGRDDDARSALRQARARFDALDAPMHAAEVDQLWARCRKEPQCQR